jgi:hypothetical protein
MNPALKTKYAIVLLLLFASLLSTLPTIALADQQSQLGTTTISLSGQAIPFDNGNGTGQPTSAALNLAGEVQRTGDSEFNIQNLTGSLQIGSATYTVYNGQGSADQDGAIWIMANTSSNVDDHQLVLNGNIQGNALTFPAPSSRLTTQFFLALNGEITMNDDQGSNMISNVTMNPNGSNASYTPLANTTPTQNSIPSITNTTLAQNSTLPQNQIGPSMNNVTTVAIQMPNNNATLTQYSNEFISTTTNPIVTQNSTELQNPTTISANNNVTTVAIQALNNVTTSQLNQSISGTSAPQVTVTVTQPQINQTITVYVTQTVADSTITQTVTGTESNVTITQSNVTTTTVANATVTVTNSTAASSTT